jgi:hypothetical protein
MDLNHGEAWNGTCCDVGKEAWKMLLQGLVLSGQVLESTFYDQVTGAAKPGYSVKLTVLDAETDEKYECQLSDGLPSLEQLQELKKQGQPADVLRQVATQLQAELPPKMSHFSFVTSWGYSRTLVQVVALANGGTPVIVAFPPSRYPGGHLLVVTGGDSSRVLVADSSIYNRTSFSRMRFLELWAGFAAVVTPQGA